MQYLAHVHRSLSVGTLPVHQMRWDWGFIIICVKICKSLFSGDKCVLILPILDPYSSHMTLPMSLRKHAYSNIQKILPPKNENFQIKNSDIFHISAQNIDCGYSLEPPRRGGSNEYPQSMFLAEIRKIIYTPVNPSFTI